MSASPGNVGRPHAARDEDEESTFAPIPIGRGGAFVERAWVIPTPHPLRGAPGRGAAHPPRENHQAEVALLVSAPHVAQFAAAPARPLIVEDATSVAEGRAAPPPGVGGSTL